MEKFRNLDYLEHELDQYHKNEEERLKEHERKLENVRKRMNREEVELLRGGAGNEDGDEDVPAPRGGGGGRSDYR